MATRAKYFLSLSLIGLSINGEAPLKLVSIEYPRLALFAKIEGTVQIAYKISDQGKPIIEQIAGKDVLLKKAAQDNFINWRFPIEETSFKHGDFKTMEYKFEIKGNCKFSFCPSEFEFTAPNKVLIIGKHPQLEP